MPANPDNIEERLVVVAEAKAALIAAHPYLSGVPVLTERKGDINQAISAALNKLGLCITIVAADAGDLTRVGTSLSLKVRLVAQISELYLVNQGASGAKKPALAAVVACMKAVDRQLNGLQPADELPMPGLFRFELPTDQPYRLIPDKTFITYHVTSYTTVLL